MYENYSDIVVVGGGMVGGALACGLAQQGFSVTVLEKNHHAGFDPGSDPDLRISAIGSASINLLQKLGVWSAVAQMRMAPYRQLETWEWQSACLTFQAAALGLPELGFMVENRVLQTALWQTMQRLQVTLNSPATLNDIIPHSGGWRVTLSDGQQLNTRLLIGADGAHSRLRQLAGIGVHGWRYSQSCLLITVRCASPAGDTTWQQFTPQGPRAFLPLHENWASLVWYDDPARIRQLQALPLAQLQKEVERSFPARLGRVRVTACAAFPLVRRHASRYVQEGLVLVGDAAHTIHPLAGQGVNLGYRDVDALLTLLTEARQQQWYSVDVLQQYQRKRYRDNLLMQSGMDLFYITFSNTCMPLKVLRNVGLVFSQHAGIIKRQVLRYALGL